MTSFAGSMSSSNYLKTEIMVKDWYEKGYQVSPPRQFHKGVDKQSHLWESCLVLGEGKRLVCRSSGQISTQPQHSNLYK